VRVFLCGGTGAIGRHAIPALVGAGHTVSALVRSEPKADEVRAAGATPVTVSIYDPLELTKAVDGHDAVVNLATALPSTKSALRASAWAPCERLRTEGSAAVVDAALAAAVPRVVQESVVMIYAGGGAAWLTEDAPVDHFPIARGNHAAEASARRFGVAGGTATVLRFGLFYGPGSAQSDELLALARKHIGFMPGRSDGYLSSIQLADAGAAVAACLEAPGGTYNVVDDQPLTKRAYANAVADAVGTTVWLRAPGRVGLLLGDRLTSLTRSVRASNRRFVDVTGWHPRYPSAREGYAAFRVNSVARFG
jgi:nucleoside-diphosphate-sugar epimerase